jgi:hypothetical protein
MPEWVQKTYWYFHGPIGHPQPITLAEGHNMGSDVVRFLITEAVLFCVLMLGLLVVKKIVTDGEAAKWISYILILIIGGIMFLKLLGFAGAI